MMQYLRASKLGDTQHYQTYTKQKYPFHVYVAMVVFQIIEVKNYPQTHCFEDEIPLKDYQSLN